MPPTDPAAAPPAILVAGSANLDIVVRAPHIPAPGETVLGHGVRSFAGGKGANQAVACARAGGAATRMLLALGDDANAVPIEASLRAAGVALHVVRSPDEPTGTAFICVADDADNAITVAPGANALLRSEHLPDLDGVSHLLLQLETPLATVTAFAQRARGAGVQVVLNAAPAQPLPAALLAALDVLVVNEGELAAVVGASHVSGAGSAGSVSGVSGAGGAGSAGGTAVAGDVIDAGMAAVAALGVPCVVVTLGARGCRALHAGLRHDQPAFRVQPVDTTAAGDTFCGAFVAALARDRAGDGDDGGGGVPRALRFASAAAALACTRPGAQDSIPTRAEVLALLQDHVLQDHVLQDHPPHDG